MRASRKEIIPVGALHAKEEKPLQSHDP